MKYFVTGATGFVGGVLARQLRKSGHEVHASVRDMNKASDLRTLGVRLFKGDVTDKESMREALQDMDGVFHVAGWYKVGVRDKSDGEKVNIEGTRNVLELMQELKIPKGVYTSTCAVNSDTHGQVVDETYRFKGKHISEYDRTKAVAHEISEEFIAAGLPLVIVMPALIYGPGDTSSLGASLRELLKGQFSMFPARAGNCFAHVEDIAAGHILAMEKGRIGETYMITGDCRSLVEAFKLASQISGKRAPIVVPAQMVKIMSILVRPFDRFLPPSYTSEGLRVVAGVTYMGDNSKARRELGYRPRAFRDGWEETVRHEMKVLGIK
ncbi:MAG TPA: NAD-dependent epimerase/dehydratase family protein [Anaerolineales bacterium]|nr:NAD-dependent epimerase/dehydratase family protein [Anaerolineales bacterium]